jgi:hypothetical protein
MDVKGYPAAGKGNLGPSYLLSVLKNFFVIPAKSGIRIKVTRNGIKRVDCRFRGNDRCSFQNAKLLHLFCFRKSNIVYSQVTARQVREDNKRLVHTLLLSEPTLANPELYL